MIITCEECSTRFTLDDSLVKPDGSKVRCSLCKHIFTVLPNLAEQTAVPADIPTGVPTGVPENIQDDIEFDEPNSPSQDMEDAFDIPFETNVDTEETIQEESDIESQEIDFDDAGFDDALESKNLDLEVQEPGDIEFEPLEESPMVDPSPLETSEIDFQDTELDFQEPDLDFEENDLGFEEGELNFEEDDLDLGAENLNFEDTLSESDATDLETDDTPDALDGIGLEMETIDLDLEEAEPVNSDPEEANLGFEEMDLEMEDMEIDPVPPPSQKTTENTADIEISFDAGDEDQELAQMPLEMNAPATPLEDIEFDSEDLTFDSSDMEFETEPADFETDLELSFEDDPDADLVFDESSPEMDLGPEKDLEQALELEETEDENISFPESDALEDHLDLDDNLPDSETRLEDNQEDTAEADKFSGYDEILDQGVEPEDEFPNLDEDISIDDFEAPPKDQKIRLEDEPDPVSPIGGVTRSESAQIQPMEPEEAPKKDRRKKSGLGGPVKLLLLLLIVIVAAYVASIRFGVGIPFLSTIEIPFLTQALKPEPPPKPVLKPIPNEASINGRFVTNDTAGELFIVTGRIENPADIAYSHIRVKGTLITKDKTKPNSQLVFCGNIISEEVLKTGNISDINTQLMVKEGLQNTNVNIKPKGAVQFMLVFSNLPENLTNFTVEVKDSQKFKK